MFLYAQSGLIDKLMGSTQKCILHLKDCIIPRAEQFALFCSI